MNKEIEMLMKALEADTDTVKVTLALPRDTAELVLAVLEAERRGGAVVVPARRDFTTSEAATILGMSRGRLTKLVDAGEIEHRMVGTHRRIPAHAITSFQDKERTIQRAKMGELADMSNAFGFTE